MENYTIKLGEILIKEQLITPEQLEKALKNQRRKKQALGELLIENGLVTERDIAVALGKQTGVPYMSLQIELLRTQITNEITELVPEKFCRERLALPLSKDQNLITVAIQDPLNLETLDNLRKMTNCEIHPVIATKTDIQEAINSIYGKKDALEKAISDTYTLVETEYGLMKEKEEVSLDELVASAEQAPVIRLVDLIINEAIISRASDIHLEPYAKYARVRYRIDSILYEISPPAKSLYLALVSRIKILSKLDISEKRLPQDGAFEVRKANKLIDIRVSSTPTIYGEKIVMRILDRSVTPLHLEDLGFLPEEQKIFEEFIYRRMGLVLITGPTGSGKTTTLYAALNTIKTPEKNILTIEDPVEYRLDGISQIQINSRIGLTFASGLRSFLRQDPDIIMVGEVRDLDTAQICVRASLTGHLVFSTVHTNDTATAVTRLTNIGLEPYLVSSSLILVVAQRLVRKLCPSCKELHSPSKDVIKELGIKTDKIYKAKGCKKCRMTGYSGQLAIYELLPVTNIIKDEINKNAPPHLIKELACKHGMRTLRESAIEKVNLQVTSIEEALRVTMGMS